MRPPGDGADRRRNAQASPFRLPVQWVNRPNLDFRGFSGMIASGTVRSGDRLRVLPSGKESRVARIVTFDGDLEEAVAGQSVTLVLQDEIDVSRGDMLSAADAAPELADQFEVTLVWMAEEPMLPGRPYRLKVGAKPAVASVTDLLVQGQCQHARSRSPRRSWSSMKSACAMSASISGSLSTPMRRTATQAASS